MLWPTVSIITVDLHVNVKKDMKVLEQFVVTSTNVLEALTIVA